MDPLPDELRIAAQRLRREEGRSFAEIALALGISASTARRWTLDIELTAMQLDRIKRLVTASARTGSDVMAEGHRALRRAWQEHGRRTALAGNPLHLAGCLLYWAEGAKSRNNARVANSDPYLLALYLRFLRECLSVDRSEVTLSLHLYTGNGLSVRQVEHHWLRLLDLTSSCLRKHSINNRPAPTSGVKHNKLPYGVATVGVLRSTWLVQHIYGGIQEYGNFEEPRWLDCARSYAD